MYGGLIIESIRDVHMNNSTVVNVRTYIIRHIRSNINGQRKNNWHTNTVNKLYESSTLSTLTANVSIVNLIKKVNKTTLVIPSHFINTRPVPQM